MHIHRFPSTQSDHWCGDFVGDFTPFRPPRVEMFCKGRVGRKLSCNHWQQPPRKLPPQSALQREFALSRLDFTEDFLPGVGWSSQRVVSAESLLQQPLDCRAQTSSYYVCYGLEGGGRVYFSRNSLRNLVDLVITSVTVLLASLVYHLDKFGGKPSTKQMFILSCCFF